MPLKEQGNRRQDLERFRTQYHSPMFKITFCTKFVLCFVSEKAKYFYHIYLKFEFQDEGCGKATLSCNILQSKQQWY